MVILLFITTSSFVLVDIGMNRGFDVIGLFLSMFTPMVAFAPALVIPALTNKVTHPVFAWLGIGGGALIGVACGVVSVFEGGIWQWMSTIATFGVSWFFYLLGMFGSRDVEGREAEGG